MALTLPAGRPLTPAEHRAGAVWLLTVSWAGRVFRFASEPCEITGNDGSTYRIEGGLGVDFALEAPFAGDAAEGDDVSIDGLAFPVDVALWHAQGRYLAGSAAELALWAPGRTLERREVVALGTVDVAEYDAHPAPVSITIRPLALDDGALIPAPEAVVTLETWPDAAEQAIGRAYPVVVGAPGLGAVAAELRGGAPALLVDATGNGRWLICDRPVVATSVTLVRVDPDGTTATQAIAPTTASDGLGRTVSVLVGTGGAVTVSATATYWVDWSGSEGGVYAEGRTTGAVGAGEVATWLLSRSTVPWDRGAWRAAAADLDRYALAFYVDEPTSPVAILREALLPLLPLSIRSGPEGLAPVLWRLGAVASDAVAVLEEGRNVIRASAARVDAARLANEIRLSYAPRASDGAPYATRTVTGRAVGGDSADVWPALPARASRLQQGERASAMETQHVYASATADRVLAWMAQAFAAPSLVIDYDAVDGGLAYLRPGDVVSLTDSGLHMAAWVAYVVGVRWAGSALTLSLLVLPAHARDPRPTGG